MGATLKTGLFSGPTRLVGRANYYEKLSMKFQADTQYELMRQVAQVIKLEDFPQGVLSYFTFEERDGFYHMQKLEKTYIDEWLFFEEVAAKIAGRVPYGIISYLGDALVMGFRGCAEVGEFHLKDDKWELFDYEYFKYREQSWAEKRLEISKDWEKLKKALA